VQFGVKDNEHCQGLCVFSWKMFASVSPHQTTECICKYVVKYIMKLKVHHTEKKKKLWQLNDVTHFFGLQLQGNAMGTDRDCSQPGQPHIASGSATLP